MKQYKYTALNMNKEKFTGTFLAENEKDLATELAKQNLFLLSASIYTGKTPSAFFTLGTGKVSMNELSMFCSQFSIMLSAGMPVLDCLEAIKDQPFTTFFKGILQVIYDDVKSGIVLSEAIKKHSKVFPDFFQSMIYVGEVSGKLDNVFLSLSEYYEKDTAIKRKTKSALSYPIMLGVMTIGILVLMLIFVVPTFRDALSSLDVELNSFTKIIYSFSDFMLANWLYVLAGFAVVFGGLFIFLKTKTGAYLFDKFKLKIPLVKKVQVDLITSRFARAFSLMIDSGMDIVESLDSVKIIIGNRDAERRFIKASEEVKHGSKLAAAFEKYNLFPQVMLQMITVGERTASLDKILKRSCAYFDEQVESSLSSLTSKILPVMLILLGGIVGGMFVAIYSPMISIMDSMI